MKFIAILIIVSIFLGKYAPEIAAVTTTSPNGSISSEVGSSRLGYRQHQHIPAGSAAISVKSPAEYLIRRYRGKRAVSRVVIDEDGTSYHCYKVKVKDGEQSKVKRGCVAVPIDKGACEVLEDKFGQSAVEECRACSSEKCNNGVTLRISSSVLGIFIFMRFLFS